MPVKRLLGQEERLTALYFCILLNVTSFITEKGPFPTLRQKINVAATYADLKLTLVHHVFGKLFPLGICPVFVRFCVSKWACLELTD